MALTMQPSLNSQPLVDEVPIRLQQAVVPEEQAVLQRYRKSPLQDQPHNLWELAA